MYQLSIAGRLGANAETRTTQGGKSVTTFRVAVDVFGGKEKQTKWVTAVMWGDRGEKVAPFLLKGSVVAVTGQLDVREHEGKHYVEIKNADVTLLGGGKRDDAPAERAKPQQSTGPYLDDQVPF